ncbi:MAG: sigma-54-dependent transcriptional regulator [Pseudobdellovibrionaceae bacterium]
MAKESLNILIVDDEVELRKSVASTLASTMMNVQFQIEEASNGIDAVNKIKQNEFDLVLMDVKMPEMNGLQALQEIKAHDPRTFVVIMTAHSNFEDAKLAIREGAYDYIEKPVKAENLISIVEKSIEARSLVAGLAFSNPIFDDDVDSEFVGQNAKMREVFNLIYKLCKVDTTVMIRGENGTGKELVARAIHVNSSKKNGSFVAINCGAIPENLIESELFGHEKGAFTGAIDRKIGKFQLANNGTLFLDEIAELKPEMQVKLLRVLQEKIFTPVGSSREMKTGARIIAATNRNLERMMSEGQFREDLFYRLNVMPIFLPPLRERTDDIPELVQHFIKKIAKQHHRDIHDISPEALLMLKSYHWPGNIRQLENTIERCFIMESSNVITVESLPEQMRTEHQTRNTERQENQTFPAKNDLESSSSVLDFDVFKEEMEKEFILSALKANKGRINQTVAQANIPKNTLLRKIKKYGINVKEFFEEK